MRYILIYISMLISYCGCNINHKAFVVENDLQGVEIKVDDIDYFNYKWSSQSLSDYYTSLNFTGDEGSNCMIYVFNDLLSYKRSEEYYGNYYDPNMPVDSIRNRYLKTDKILKDLKSFESNGLKYRIYNIKDKEYPFFSTMATIMKDSLIVFYRAGGISKNENYFFNNEKMIKSIRINKIKKLDQ